jgi:hypothetical protein
MQPSYFSTTSRTYPIHLPAYKGNVDQSAIDTLMSEHGLTEGLIHALAPNRLAIAHTIWLVDNSTSMLTADGSCHVVNSQGGNNSVHFAPCTRWHELQQTVEYHAHLAALIKAPTTFRLINDPGLHVGPQQFSIADRGHESDIDDELSTAYHVMSNAQPSGATPLTQHIIEICEEVMQLLPMLVTVNAKVAIVIATNGMPTDDLGVADGQVQADFEAALQSLAGLPILLVVRLCTNERDVVDYWNSIDVVLEPDLDILDDFENEAREVDQHNGWLNYSMPLHRMREMGFYHRVFDLLDESPLTPDQLLEFCQIIFGRGPMLRAPSPDCDWYGFCVFLSELQMGERRQWNPIRKRMEPWIDVEKLNALHDVYS